MGGLVEQLPDADNRVTLDPDVRDDHGNPVPHIEWSLSERTRRALRRANEIQHAILAELGVDIEWTVGPEATGPAYHQMGTTRMGTDPASSVVDADCRAHDLPNLRIVGSSVFPTGGAMNPTLTIAALALRVAESMAESV
jgi:choline dehydrogenase-like flavoprotein